MARVVIGVPVYNGASLIRECLESLAAQSFEDFSVVISDNASDDGTTDICADFCAHDRRFVHHLRNRTVSANENFLSLLSNADSEYFAYRAYDDLSTPNWLRTLFALLQASPHSRLAVGTVIQVLGTVERNRAFPYPNLLPVGRRDRTTKIFNEMFFGTASWFYGLWRTQALRESFHEVMKMYSDPWGSDHLIVLHAILRDAVVGADKEAEFIQRILPVDRFYIPKVRPNFAEMKDRNRRFHDTALKLLANCGNDRLMHKIIQPALAAYTLHRCHGPRRLFQARLKSIFKQAN